MSALAALSRLALLGAIGWVVLVVELSPFRLAPGASATMPDLLFCLFGALALRRPSAAASPLVFALGLARDLVSGGPVGPGALGLTLAIELLRSGGFRRLSFIAKWLLAGCAFGFGLTVAAALLLASFSPAPSVDALAARFVATALAFPPAYMMSWLLLRPETRTGRLNEGGG